MTLNFNTKNSLFLHDTEKNSKNDEQKEKDVNRFNEVMNLFSNGKIDLEVDDIMDTVNTIKLKASDFDNIGFNIYQYIQNPAIELWLKVLYYVVNHYRKHPNIPLRSTYQRIAFRLNKLGCKTAKGDGCTAEGVKTAIEQLVADGVINKEINPEIMEECEPGTGDYYRCSTTNKFCRCHKEKTGNYKVIKKEDFYNKRKWYYRSLTVNFNKLFELTCHVNIDDVHSVYKGKDRKKKYHLKGLMKAKFLIDIMYMKMSVKAKKKFASAKEMFQSYVFNISLKYFDGYNNKYLTKMHAPAPDKDLSEEDEARIDKMYAGSQVEVDKARRESCSNAQKPLQDNENQAKTSNISSDKQSIIDMIEKILCRELLSQEQQIFDSYSYTQLVQATDYWYTVGKMLNFKNLRNILAEFNPEIIPGTSFEITQSK